MSLKNPLRPLADTEKNKKELRGLSQTQWDDLSNAQKLSRIALCKKIGDFSLIKFEYDLDQIIKNYNLDKNGTRRQIKQGYEENISKREETIASLECEIKSRDVKYHSLKKEYKQSTIELEREKTENINLKQEHEDKIQHINEKLASRKERYTYLQNEHRKLVLELEREISKNKNLTGKIKTLETNFEKEINELKSRLKSIDNEYEKKIKGMNVEMERLKKENERVRCELSGYINNPLIDLRPKPSGVIFL